MIHVLFGGYGILWALRVHTRPLVREASDPPLVPARRPQPCEAAHCTAVPSSFLTTEPSCCSEALVLTCSWPPGDYHILIYFLWIILWIPCYRDWVFPQDSAGIMSLFSGAGRVEVSTWKADPLIKCATTLYLLLCHSESVWSGGGQNVQALQIAANSYWGLQI